MKRFERIIALFVKLQTSQFVTAKTLADEFGVSERTIYRDIRAMEEAGVPVLSEPARGFRFMNGFRIPPVGFSENEMNALITAELILQRNPDALIAKSYSDALDKIRAIIRYQEQERVEILDQRLTFSTQKESAHNTSWLSTIQTAITKNHLLKITYVSISKDESTVREVEPYGIYLTANAWVMIGHCRLRTDFREFRLDQIKELVVLPEVFLNRSFDLEKYFGRNLS